MIRRQGPPTRHIVDTLFVLALFGVFAACALTLVTLGANVYKQTAASMSDNFTERTVYSYLTEKLRQNDTSGTVSIGELSGTEALILTTRLGGEEYCTYLYLYEGNLKELYVRKDSFTGTDILSAGQNVIALNGLSMEETKDGLLKFTLDTGNGNPVTLFAVLRADYS